VKFISKKYIKNLDFSSFKINCVKMASSGWSLPCSGPKVVDLSEIIEAEKYEK
jgi:hypothetical protein